MKLQTGILVTAAAAVIFTPAAFIGDEHTAKIKAVKIQAIHRDHKEFCEALRHGIEAGYTVCRLGIPLTNYLAEVQKEWDKILDRRLAEENREKNK